MAAAPDRLRRLLPAAGTPTANRSARAKAIGALIGNNGKITYQINSFQTSSWIYGTVTNGIWVNNVSSAVPHGVNNAAGDSADSDADHVINVSNYTLSALLDASAASLGILNFATIWGKASPGLPYLRALSNPCPGNTCAVAAGKAARPRKIALLFANSDYSRNGIPDLNTPANDVARVSEALHNKLGFVTRDLARLLRRVPAKNIMLVADSCYSGSFTKEQNFQGGNRAGTLEDLGNLRGVMAMASGGDEPVMDGEVNSPFARSLVGRMKEISVTTAGDELYNRVKADVTATTPQTPQYGVISSARYDPGADYLIRENRARVSAR